MPAAWQHTLVRSWTRRGPLAHALRPLSWLYGGLWVLRRAAYARGWLASERLSVSVPVVVVGNVVAGGSGKTPVVMAIVQQLRNWGWTPGMVSRGHGRQLRELHVLGPASTPEQAGDEPLLLARATAAPMAVGARRGAAARALLQRHPEVDIVVSDDGLQHLAMARDVEICVFDERGTGNGWLLPAGPLREPWPRRVDLVLQPAGTAVDPAGFGLMRALASHAVRADGTRVPLADLARAATEGGPVLWAMAGIAHPERFFGMLRAHGLPLAGTRALPDHAPPAAFDWPQARTGLLLCTEKDVAKLRSLRPDALAVPLELTIDPVFWQALQDCLPPAPRTPQQAGPKL